MGVFVERDFFLCLPVVSAVTLILLPFLVPPNTKHPCHKTIVTVIMIVMIITMMKV